MLGKASGIKTNYVEAGNFDIDEMVNNFLELNPNVVVINIQYQSILNQIYQGDGIYRHEMLQTAFIIYKEESA